MSNLYLKL